MTRDGMKRLPNAKIRVGWTDAVSLVMCKLGVGVIINTDLWQP